MVRAQFDDPANVIKRARYFAEPARQAWSEMNFDIASASPLKLLTAAYQAANAVASLNGAPIPERRLLAEFPARAKSLEQDYLIQSLFSAIAKNVSVETILHRLAGWEAAFQAAAQSPADLRLHSARLAYYKSAIESQLTSDLPRAALWPMLHTWALAAENGSFDDEQIRIWGGVCSEMGLDAVALPERLHSLDVFLDSLEELEESGPVLVEPRTARDHVARKAGITQLQSCQRRRRGAGQAQQAGRAVGAADVGIVPRRKRLLTFNDFEPVGELQRNRAAPARRPVEIGRRIDRWYYRNLWRIAIHGHPRLESADVETVGKAFAERVGQIAPRRNVGGGLETADIDRAQHLHPKIMDLALGRAFHAVPRQPHGRLRSDRAAADPHAPCFGRPLRHDRLYAGNREET